MCKTNNFDYDCLLAVPITLPCPAPTAIELNILTWFNIHSADHLVAWRRLGTMGEWPEHFIPRYMEFPANWQYALAVRMADAHVEQALETQG